MYQTPLWQDSLTWCTSMLHAGRHGIHRLQADTYSKSNSQGVEKIYRSCRQLKRASECQLRNATRIFALGDSGSSMSGATQHGIFASRGKPVITK
jgi:hypothetical protein